MNEVWNDPKVWFYVAGIISQAAIAWWRVKELEKRVGELRSDIKDIRKEVSANGSFRERASIDIERLMRRVFNGSRE